MCRLLGVSFGKEREDLDAGEIAAILFPALVRQGPHAYGWATYNEADDRIEYEKHPGRCDTDLAYDNIIEGVDPDAKWLIGHTRYATHGSPEDNRNNHPLPHGNILGVHNGILSNHEDILKWTGREIEGTEVDSEAIFAAVNRWGHQPGLRRVRGDMVTIYVDRRYPKTIRLARTAGRQITLAWSDRGNLFFASDRFALEALTPEINFTKFSTVSENRLLVIREGEIRERHTFRKVEPKPKWEWRPTPPARTLPALRTGPVGPAEIAATTRLIEAQARLNERRASKRGEILFPRKPAQEAAKPSEEQVRIHLSKKQRKRATKAAKAKGLVLVGGRWVPKEIYERELAEIDRENARLAAADALADEEFDPRACYGD